MLHQLAVGKKCDRRLKKIDKQERQIKISETLWIVLSKWRLNHYTV